MFFLLVPSIMLALVVLSVAFQGRSDATLDAVRLLEPTDGSHHHTALGEGKVRNLVCQRSPSLLFIVSSLAPKD